jgi:hypothetical protein
LKQPWPKLGFGYIESSLRANSAGSEVGTTESSTVRLPYDYIVHITSRRAGPQHRSGWATCQRGFRGSSYGVQLWVVVHLGFPKNGLASSPHVQVASTPVSLEWAAAILPLGFWWDTASKMHSQMAIFPASGYQPSRILRSRWASQEEKTREEEAWRERLRVIRYTIHPIHDTPHVLHSKRYHHMHTHRISGGSR